MARNSLTDPPPIYGASAPIPTDGAEAKRVAHSRLRRRMLAGVWQTDANERHRQRMGRIRATVHGDADLTRCVFTQAYSNLATLYSELPTIGNRFEPDAAPDLYEVVSKVGLYPMMQRFQRDTLALREMFMRVDVAYDFRRRLRVVFRPVFPDMVWIRPDPMDPSQPIELHELHEREKPGDGFAGEMIWTWDVWDIRDPNAPVHRVLSADRRIDLSHHYGLSPGGAVGEEYPSMCRRADGSAFIPYVTYHAAITGLMWDTYHGIELVNASLEIAAKLAFVSNGEKNSSYGKTVAWGLIPPDAKNLGTHSEIVVDSNTMSFFAIQPGFTGQPSIQTLPATMDIIKSMEAVQLYSADVLAMAGDPADVSRTSGGVQGSGFALAVNAEQKAAVTRRYAPIFQHPDEELLCMVATMINRVVGPIEGHNLYPEEGWTIAYSGLTAPGATVGGTAGETIKPTLPVAE